MKRPGKSSVRVAAIAAVTSVALVLGLAPLACSSTTVTAAPVATDAADGIDADDDAAEAAVDAARMKGCPGQTPATYAWQPPVAAQLTACAEGDLSKLATAIAQKSLVTDGDIAVALGPSCAACAIGRVSDDHWRAVVAGHEGYIGNVGGCAMLLGANETCGTAIDRLSTCLIAGCDGCADRKAQDACADQLTTVDGPCAPALTTMRKQCPAAALVSAFDTNGVCQSFVQTIRLFCGPRAQDGG
ncbi:MAG: hypothetical protein JWO86_8956 [Myxococcaceae bacterium]|nr:hypothetical protein [Myxococcaceae bacterium]MEA2749829.1 hypothetical protein [Myxococcales bacterium]